MTDPASPAPYPVRNEEHHAMVRRRALPIGIAGALCGLGALALLLTAHVDVGRPPNIYAVNLSFCAMLMGIGIIYYARHTPGTTTAVAASILALLTGFAGPLLFTKQTLDFKKVTESGELANVQAIETAARTYADSHAGDYPADLATLIENKLVTFQTLHSPYEAGGFTWPEKWSSHEELQKTIDDHADFQYFGAGLKTLPADAPEESVIAFSQIVIVAKKYPIARKEISIGFGDGHAAFVGGEDWERTWDQSNTARRHLGFAEIRRPSMGAVEPATSPVDKPHL